MAGKAQGWLCLLQFLSNPVEEAVWVCFGGFLKVFPLQEFCAYCSAEWCVNVSEWKEQIHSKKILEDLHDGTEKT